MLLPSRRIVDSRDLDLLFQKPSSKMAGSPQMESNAGFRIAAPIKGAGNVGEVRAQGEFALHQNPRRFWALTPKGEQSRKFLL